MYITTTGTVVAYLTRTGRQLLADNSAEFNVSHFRLSDDGMDYTLFDGTTEDAVNSVILSTPILETTTLDTVPAQRYELFSAEAGLLNLSWIDADIGRPFVDGKQNERPYRESVNLWIRYDSPNLAGQSALPYNTSFLIKTLYGNDSMYYVNSSNNNIVAPLSKRPSSLPDTDPTQTWQNQSQAEVKLALTIKPTTQVSVDPNSIPSKRPAARARWPGPWRPAGAGRR